MLIVENLPIHNLVGPMTDEELYLFCRANADLQIERDSQHNIIIMSPASGSSGFRELKIMTYLNLWAENDNTGLAFSSSTGFYLSNGAMRSPDAAWLSLPRWNALSEKQKDRFLSAVPEFVVELRSPSDRLSKLKQKCTEWIDNGVQLLWLIDPKSETNWIYRANGGCEEVIGFDKILSGEGVLPGFAFSLSRLVLPG